MNVDQLHDIAEAEFDKLRRLGKTTDQILAAINSLAENNSQSTAVRIKRRIYGPARIALWNYLSAKAREEHNSHDHR